MVIKEEHITKRKDSELRVVGISDLVLTISGGWEGGKSEGLREKPLVGDESHVIFSCAKTEGVEKRQDAREYNRISSIESSEVRKPFQPMVADTIRQQSGVQIARLIQGVRSGRLTEEGH